MGRPTQDKKDEIFRMRMSETEKNKLKELAKDKWGIYFENRLVNFKTF